MSERLCPIGSIGSVGSERNGRKTASEKMKWKYVCVLVSVREDEMEVRLCSSQCPRRWNGSKFVF